MALPLRTNVRFSPSEGITQLVPSREARVYNCGVGPGVPTFYGGFGDAVCSLDVLHSGSTAPTIGRDWQ
jgi:hypothetical protein